MFNKFNKYGKIIMITVLFAIAMITSPNKTKASEGDIWLTPVNQNVGTSESFDIEVHVDTGGNNMGAFDIYFDFSTSDVSIDTSQGTDGVDKGTDGSSYSLVVNSTDLANGHLRIAGTISSGFPNGTDVHILTIHAQTTSSFSSGTSSLDLRVTDLLDENANALSSGTITGATITYPVTDTTPPTLAEVTPVSTPTSDSTPNYIFSTTEAGTITYGGSCSSSTTQATVGNNTITFSSLSDGTYSDCTITVTDASGNASDALSITSFTVDTSVPDTSAPTISNGNSSKSGSGNSVQVTLSVNTDENATCRYSTVSGRGYGSMTNTFSTTGGTSHQTTVTGLTEGNTYNFYVRCNDGSGNMNGSDYSIRVSTIANSDSNNTGSENSEDEIVATSTGVDVKELKVKALKKGATTSVSKNKKVHTKEKKVKFKGKVEGLAGGKVQIYIDKKLKYTVNLKSDGNWSKKIKLKKDGTHTIKFKYVDSSGTVVKESSKYKVKVDRKKPKFKKMLSFLNKHRGDKIWWKATDNNKISYYKYYFNGKTRKTKKGSFIVPANTPRGIYTLKIKAYDKAGNKATKYVVIRVR